MKNIITFLILFCLISSGIYAQGINTTNLPSITNLSSTVAIKQRYVLTLELRQTHFTISISQHVKDAYNATTFEIPVDKEFYEQVKVGDVLTDKFRTGSLLLSGSFGNWKVTIKKKKVETIQLEKQEK